MYLVERAWAVVTSVFNIVSFAPVLGEIDRQTPLSRLFPPSLPEVHDAAQPDYPIFHPPTASDKVDFTFRYPSMIGWEGCSTPLDRKCWLRRKSDGKQFDVYMNYETKTPIGVTRHYNIDVNDSWYAADGLNFTAAKLFNNTYPGPWIQACWGDRVVVNVTNSMRHNGTSIHWHGIRQLNSSQMDGVNGITQCPIAAGDHFVYDFTVGQYGSSWYHSHYSVQYADGATGALTIHGPTSADWDEVISPPLILTDWFHESSFAVIAGSDNGGKDILLNGRGNITRFNNKIANTTTIEPALNITFEKPKPGKTVKKYLLRVINTSFDTTFVFIIDNHLLKVVSADFVPITPYRNTSILVGIGQRYNVIVEANPLSKENPLDPNGNYWIRTQIATCFRGSNQGDLSYDQAGILRYDPKSKLDPTTKKWPNISIACSDETYTSLHPSCLRR